MELEQRSDNRNTALGSQSAARALAVLDLLGDSTGELGVREIARQLSLAPSIVQRLIQPLAARGYVERASDGQKYRIGLRAFQVGRRYLAYNDLHAASLPELRAMAEQERVNAYLGVLRDRLVVYLDAVQSTGPIAIVSKPGSSAALHSTAFGKALLAELPDEQIADLIGPGPFVRFTKKTKTSLAALMKDVRQARRTRCAFSDEENIENVFAAGAVIRDASGEAVGALSGALPRHQLNPAGIEKLSRIVVEAADRISHRLGATPFRLARQA
jgi:DNA-binding IclR family transcriptional regulator